jgi:RHS repeat-associated protein
MLTNCRIIPVIALAVGGAALGSPALIPSPRRQGDAAGNLSVDEDGRQYFYDEQNRLTLVKKPDGTPLQSYAYDALGRRVTSKDELGNFKVRYYYDGQSVIEERNDATDVPGSATAGLLRYHIHGGQYVDEHIATFTVATNSYRYYLHNRLWSVAGTGDKTGSSITQLDYSSGGSFAGSVATPVHHDSDDDDDVDLRDFDDFAHCFGTTTSGCLARHDFGTASTADGQINLTDHIGFVNCFGGRFGDLPPTCTAASTPASGAFTLHGAMLDVLPDGQTLEYGRARYLDIKHSRWLQRDPIGYADGMNLYEAFGSNPTGNIDPMGTRYYLRIEFTDTGELALAGSFWKDGTYEYLGQFDPGDPEFVWMKTTDGTRKVPFKLITKEANRWILHPWSASGWAEWAVNKGIIRSSSQE